MKNLLITDLDGTLLDKGVLSEGNKETISNVKNYGVDVIVSTGKGLLRVDSHLKEQVASGMILENGSKIHMNGETDETLIGPDKYEQLFGLLDKIMHDIDFLFFYDSNNNEQACFYENQEEGIPEEFAEKFKNIRTEELNFDLRDLLNNIRTGGHNLGLLNIKIKAESLEELGLEEYQDDFYLVFNEGMLNISLANKGDAVRKIVHPTQEEVGAILVAGNDKNDIPMMEAALEISEYTKTEVGLMVVGRSLDDELQRLQEKGNPKIITVDDPNFAFEGIQKFY